MKKKQVDELDDLRPEYDLKKMIRVGARGKYATKYHSGTNLILLAPDVARVFPTDEAVNEALRLVIKLKQIKTRPKRKAA